MTDCIQVVTTTESQTAAAQLARGPVRERLAACAQVVGPISSTFWWNGELQYETEFQVIYKTTQRRRPELEAWIRERHSYAEPEIIAVPIVAGSRGYLRWIEQETTVRPG